MRDGSTCCLLILDSKCVVSMMRCTFSLGVRSRYLFHFLPFCSLLGFVFAGNSRPGPSSAGLDMKRNKVLAMQSSLQLQPCLAAPCCSDSGPAGNPACPGIGEPVVYGWWSCCQHGGPGWPSHGFPGPAEGLLAVLSQARGAGALPPPGRGGFGLLSHQSPQGRSDRGVRPAGVSARPDAL